MRLVPQRKRGEERVELACCTAVSAGREGGRWEEFNGMVVVPRQTRRNGAVLHWLERCFTSGECAVLTASNGDVQMEGELSNGTLEPIIGSTYRQKPTMRDSFTPDRLAYMA